MNSLEGMETPSRINYAGTVFLSRIFRAAATVAAKDIRPEINYLSI
jgi:hypothetical protein